MADLEVQTSAALASAEKGHYVSARAELNGAIAILNAMDRRMLLTDELIRKAVDAYDAERCRAHGWSVDVAGMSEPNKRAIAPLIAAAIRAALEEIDNATTRDTELTLEYWQNELSRRFNRVK